MASSEPLLEGDMEIGQAVPPQLPLARRNKQRLACYSAVGLIIVLILLCIGYLAMIGAFDPIDHDVRIMNGTVTEPNTHQVFPLQRSATLLGLKQIQRLIGVSIETVTKAHVSIKIFAMAMYVDRTEARKQLAKYRKGVPDAKHAEFAQFLSIFTRGDLTFMIEQRMLIAAPGTRFQDGMADTLTEYWKQYNCTVSEVKDMRTCFVTWFEAKSVHAGETYMFEYSAKTRAMRKAVNGKLAGNECKQPKFAQGFIAMQLSEYSNGYVNLLETLWDQRYDND